MHEFIEEGMRSDMLLKHTVKEIINILNLMITMILSQANMSLIGMQIIYIHGQ